MKTALIIQGGWVGHEPQILAEFFATRLEAEGFTVSISNTLSTLNDLDGLRAYDLISPCWTMGTLSEAQSRNLCEAVYSGVGLAGFHGGMGDAFRGDLNYEWMVGGHFVGHPHVGEYVVDVKDTTNPITQGLPDSFVYDSEQYYMMVDPCIEVLADTIYRNEDQAITMPVIWTKQWGKGRVFYSAIGHRADEFTRYPAVAKMTLDGMKWATR